MASNALALWELNRAAALNEFVQLHRLVGRAGAGTQNARQQINQAYVLMLAGQFQGYCRDLHSEGVDHLVDAVQPVSLRSMMKAQLQLGRKLDHGNPDAGNIGSDFNRFELKFWQSVLAFDARLTVHQRALSQLVQLRNKIAHQDFDTMNSSSGLSIRHAQVRSWRNSCGELATAFDRVLGEHLSALTGARPW